MGILQTTNDVGDQWSGRRMMPGRCLRHEGDVMRIS